MNKFHFLLIGLLLVGLIGSYLYQHHGLAAVQPGLAAIRAHLPAAPVAVQPKALQAQCGCTVDTDEHIPMTPQEIMQAKIKQKREAAREKIRETQIASRLHRLVRVGMPRKQVEQIMGQIEGEETPPEPFKGHTAVDSNDYGDYEVAFSAKDTVAWVRPL